MPLCQSYFLGTPRIVVDGEPVRFRQQKTIALLAYLALDGTIQTRDHLASFFWPTSTANRARNSLRTVLWEMNKSKLASWITTDRHTVTLRIDNSLWVDILDLKDTLSSRQYHGHNLSQLCPACIPTLRHVIDSWKGDFLSGLALKQCMEFEDWQFWNNDNIRESMTLAYEGLVNWSIHHREFTTAQNLCLKWRNFDPLAEQPFSHLMYVYSQQNQRSLVLRTIDQYLHMMTHEIDAEPSPEMASLIQKIKQGNLKDHVQRIDRGIKGDILSITDSAPFQLQTIVNTPPNNIPAPLTSLIGRNDDVQTVTHLLCQPDVRLLTLTGPGGTGKTRLSIETARKVLHFYPDGVYFVSLASITDSTYLIRTIAITLGLINIQDNVIDHSQNNEIFGEYWRTVLTQYLKDRKILIILDNFEHIISAKKCITPLLSAASHLNILVTSRTALHLYGEYLVDVTPLDVPQHDIECTPADIMQYPAAQLFVERAKAVQPNIILNAENCSDIARICRSLDGLPLALELAAARVRRLSFADIVVFLENRLDFFTQSPTIMEPRHQTLRATLDWSYKLLKSNEKVLLHRLSVFNTSFDLERAQKVGGYSGDFDVYDTLIALADQNIIRIYQLDEIKRGEMLGVVRDYALEKLKLSGAEQQVRKHHAVAYLEICTQAEDKLYKFNADQAGWMDRLDTEIYNIRDALSWSHKNDPVLALELSTVLGWFWRLYGTQLEGYRELLKALEDIEAASNIHPDDILHLRARGYYTAGVLATSVDMTNASSLFQTGLKLYRILEDTAGIGGCLSELGVQLMNQTRFAEADTLMLKAITLLAQSSDNRLLARAHCNRANLKNFTGEWKVAENHTRQACEIGKAKGDLWFDVWASTIRANSALLQQDFDTALDIYSGVLALTRSARDADFEMVCLSYMGNAALGKGDPQLAKEYYEATIACQHRVGLKGMVAWAMTHLSSILINEGNLHTARNLLQQALHIAEYIKSTWLTTWIPYSIAKTEIALGNNDTAEEYLLQCMANDNEIVSEVYLGVNCVCLARIALMQGQYTRALRLIGAADYFIDSKNLNDEVAEGLYHESLTESRLWLSGLHTDLQQLMERSAYENGLCFGNDIARIYSNNLVKHLA